jgi:hypothetical protein
VISSGVSVPYSDEYRELRSNPTTLETLASLTDGKVVAWKQTPDGRIDLARTLDGVDHFRRDPGLINPHSLSPLWPVLLWLALCTFLGDVAVRRIAIDLDWIKLTIANEWRKLRGQEPAAASDYMDKLKSRKAEVDEQLDRSRSVTQRQAEPLPFPTAAPSGEIGEPLLEGDEARSAARLAERAQAPSIAASPSPPEQEGYTNRLLKAKQRVWEEREKEKEKEKTKDLNKPGA